MGWYGVGERFLCGSGCGRSKEDGAKEIVDVGASQGVRGPTSYEGRLGIAGG